MYDKYLDVRLWFTEAESEQLQRHFEKENNKSSDKIIENMVRNYMMRYPLDEASQSIVHEDDILNKRKFEELRTLLLSVYADEMQEIITSLQDVQITPEEFQEFALFIEKTAKTPTDVKFSIQRYAISKSKWRNVSVELKEIIESVVSYSYDNALTSTYNVMDLIKAFIITTYSMYAGILNKKIVNTIQHQSYIIQEEEKQQIDQTITLHLSLGEEEWQREMHKANYAYHRRNHTNRKGVTCPYCIAEGV